MFKPTRFKQALMYLGLIAIGEEAMVMDADLSAMTDGERNGALVNKVNTMPMENLQSFLKAHHLKIAPEAFASHDAGVDIAAPLSTPALNQVSSSKSVA